MKKLMLLLLLVLASAPMLASGSGESGTYCFQGGEGYGETIILDKSESIDGAMETYRAASNPAAHFASCLAVFNGGISLSMVKDQCNCLSAAMEVCSPPSNIRDWRDMSSDCKSFLPWGSY